MCIISIFSPCNSSSPKIQGSNSIHLYHIPKFPHLKENPNHGNSKEHLWNLGYYFDSLGLEASKPLIFYTMLNLETCDDTSLKKWCSLGLFS
jgi:hypothetical protein